MDGFERGGQVAVGGSGVKSSVGAVLGVTWATVGGQGNGLWLGSRQQRAFLRRQQSAVHRGEAAAKGRPGLCNPRATLTVVRGARRVLWEVRARAWSAMAEAG